MRSERLALVNGPDATAAGANGSSEEHPAPARRDAALSALWFGFVGAPAAWSVQTLVNLSLVSHSCYPRLTPLASPATGGVRGIAFTVSLVALAVCLAAAFVSWRTWWRTREEHQRGSGRAQQHQPSSALLETGEGRTRFMALAGVLTSVTFLVVSALHMSTIFLVSPCGW
jgi:hypothetical protein